MSLTVCCFTNCFLRFGAEVAIKNLAGTGIDKIELAIRTESRPSFFKDPPLVSDQSTPEDLERVDQLLKEHRIQVVSCNLTSGNPLEADVVEITKRKLDRAAHYGVDRVVAGAGEAESDADLQQLYANLRELGDHAAGLGITYCFETHPGICVSAELMQRTMEELDHPNLRLNFDTGNIFYYNEGVDLEASLRRVSPWIAHVHLKDSTGKPKDWNFAELGTGGAVDFVLVRTILDKQGFRGPYSLELEGIGDEPPQSVETYAARITNSVKRLHEWGYFD